MGLGNRGWGFKLEVKGLGLRVPQVVFRASPDKGGTVDTKKPV